MSNTVYKSFIDLEESYWRILYIRWRIDRGVAFGCLEGEFKNLIYSL